MCSQECMAKMKSICLNTVQVLFKDAFDRFSSNIASRNSLPDRPGDEATAGVHQAALSASKEATEFCQRASTSFEHPNNNDRTCLDGAPDEYPAPVDDDQNCQNQPNNRPTSQFRNQQSGHPANQQTNRSNTHQTNQSAGQQSNQLQWPAERRSLSQLVLCNLMQNLVDAVNEQCVKQLPGQVQIEKKKRKRKRKRKKSKSELPDEQTPNEQTSNERKQMRRMEGLTNELLKPADKIRLDNGTFAEASHSRQSGDGHRQTPDSLGKNESRPKENFQCGLMPMKGDESTRGAHSHASHRQLSPSESRATNSVRPAKRALGERCLKRKRDESPNYKEKRRITSARKLPTAYKRKRLSSPSSSCSEDSSSASSIGSSSSDDELTDFGNC